MAGRYREDPVAPHLQTIRDQRQVLKHVDTSLAREKELLRRVRSEIAELLKHRAAALAQIREAREAITAERERAHQALVDSIIARVNRRMTPEHIAAELHLHPRRVDRLIAERQRSAGLSRVSRRPRHQPVRRTRG